MTKPLPELLHEIGEKRTVAEVMSYLLDKQFVTSREIEVNTGLRQPEVSLALSCLYDRGMIMRRHGDIPPRGRPEITYCLMYTLHDLIDLYEKDFRELLHEIEIHLDD
jgi:predicted transcriptional regulator